MDAISKFVISCAFRYIDDTSIKKIEKILHGGLNEIN